MTKQKEKAIKEAIKKLNIEMKDIYSAKELNNIAAAASVQLIDVMMYLRFEKLF